MTPLCRHGVVWAALGLGCLLAALYWPATGYDFVLYDDDRYVFANPQVLGGVTCEGVKEAFRPLQRFVIPVTVLSLQADATLFGPGPFGFHLTNILIFALACALLVPLFQRLLGSLSAAAFAAALFALHPMRVESVAWVTERKDCLALLFLVLALLAYLRFVASKDKRWMLAVAALFTLGLLSKPVLVTFPLLLLLLDAWPLHRWALPVLREKIPLFALSAGFSLLTLATHWPASFSPDIPDPWPVRWERFLSAPFIYLGKTLWPFDLSVMDRLPPSHPDWEILLLSAAALAAITWVLWRLRSRGPLPLFAWLWFLVALLPDAGLVRTGTTLVADRFTLLPHLGLALALGGALRAASPIRPPVWAKAGWGALLLLALALALLTRAQLPVWKDSFSLFSRAMLFEPPLLSYRNLALAVDQIQDDAGRDRAIAVMEAALQRRPENPAPHYHLANLYFAKGDLPRAIAEYRLVLKGPPPPVDERAFAHYRLGLALAASGSPGDAIPHFRETLRLRREEGAAHPALDGAHYHLGVALAECGRWEEAAGELRAALAIDPKDERAAAALKGALRHGGE